MDNGPWSKKITDNRQLTTDNQNAWRQPVAFWCLAVMLAGLFTFQSFRILSSLGLAVLLLLAFTRPRLGELLKFLVQQRLFLAFPFILLLHSLTFLYTDPPFYPQWWEGLLLKLPFLLLPLALALVGPLPARWLELLYYFFLLLVFLGALYSLGQYLLHYQQINQSYHRSGVMPTLVNHVRFSLMVAFAICIGMRLLWQRFYWRHPGERIWIGAITLFLFAFLHVLAVRSGLAAFYAVVLLALAYGVRARRTRKLALALGLLLLLVPVLSFLFLPTFKEKLNYTLYDLAQRHDQTKANNYSLTGRLYSYKVGLAVWQQRPLIGWGMGNIQPAIRHTYQSLFPGIGPQAYRIPHNQFLYYLGLLGGIGLFCFLVSFYYPLWAYWRQADVLLSVHYLIISVSFLFEPTLETQVGLLYGLLFALLPLAVMKPAVAEEPLGKI
jgi:O-antigen ligase